MNNKKGDRQEKRADVEDRVAGTSIKVRSEPMDSRSRMSAQWRLASTMPNGDPPAVMLWGTE